MTKRVSMTGNDLSTTERITTIVNWQSEIELLDETSTNETILPVIPNLFRNPF